MSSNRFVRIIDRLSAELGRVISWLALIMILIGAYNAIARYLGRFIGYNLSSNLYLELQWYIFSVLFLLGASYALKEDAHVRVDVLYGRLNARARAWIDVVGGVLFLLPFSAFVLFVSWPSVRNSWAIREVSPDPGGLPRYPLKAVILACFVLLMLQGLSQLIKDIETIRGHGDDPAGPGGNSVAAEGDLGDRASDASHSGGDLGDRGSDASPLGSDI